MISAARSGSTEFALGLSHAETYVYGVPMLFVVMPFRWLWAVLGATVGQCVTPSPATHALSTQWKAGETVAVFHTF